MPKHKQSSSPTKKGMYLNYRAAHQAFKNKVRDLKKHIKMHTIAGICSDSCAVEALRRLEAAAIWKKPNRHIKG